MLGSELGLASVTFRVPFLHDGQHDADSEAANETENFGDDDPKCNGQFVVALSVSGYS